jgi:hypothetical protein
MAKKFTNIFAGHFRAVQDAPVEKMWAVGSSALPLESSPGDFDAGHT